MENKLSRIRELMVKKRLDTILLFKTDSLRYLTNIYSPDFKAIFVLPRKAEPFIICSLFDKFALNRIPIKSYSVSSEMHADIKAKSMTEALQKIMKKKNIKLGRYAYERNLLPILSVQSIEKRFGKGTDFSNEMLEIRSIKTEKEIRILRQGAEYTAKGMGAVLEAIEPGMTERELASVFESAVRKHVDWFSFQTIVAAGQNSAEPHFAVSDRKIREKEFIVFDCGVIYKNLCTDMTRTFAINPDKHMERIYNHVLKAQDAAMKVIKVGAKCNAPDTAARKYFTEKGVKDNFIHSLGHGVGVAIHELPNLYDKKTKFKENMVFTIEPGLYFSGYGGVRIEDMVLLTKDGIDVLTKFPRVLRCR